MRRAFLCAALLIAATAQTPERRYAIWPIGYDRYELTLKIGDEDHAVPATPSPRPIWLIAVTTKKPTPLHLETVAGLSLLYESPNMPAGFYTLAFSPSSPGAVAFYLPEAPGKMAALVPGQQFIAFEGLPRHPATDANGKSFGPYAVTLTSVTPTMLRFRTHSGQTFSTAKLRSVNDVVGMIPVVDDAAVEQLRARYLGRIVYTTPSFQGLSNGGGTFGGPSQTLRVAGIYRTYDYVGSVSLDGAYLDGDMFGAVDPIVITFDQCPHSFYSTENECDVLYTQSFDPWHVERILSLRPLIDSNWPAPFRDAVEKHQVLPGMNYDMVAAAIGYPTIPGSIAHLKKLNTWSYAWPPPGDRTVEFAQGVVTKYHPATQMP